MQTNNIKSFAKKARLILMEGVTQRLKYWGFDDNGSTNIEVKPTSGGYSFREQVFTDVSVPAKWNKLKGRLKDRQSVQDVVEEAAYTWFNRIMALKILEVNGFLPAQIGYSEGTRTPMLVQNAKRGNHGLQKQANIDLLQGYLKESNEEQALGLLLTRLCNNNRLLHDIFGRIDDYTELLIPQNLLQKNGIFDLINSDFIAEEDYLEVELIGWLYQFYISDKKDQVFAGFKKNKKARPEDIPAATSIFTPKWIVKYMVENTVGKLYLDYEPNSIIKAEMKYLVANNSDQVSKPIISDIIQLTLLDPACGSGHILVTGFDLLFRMYRAEGYTAHHAVENILIHNLFGLEIDDRSMQLARFALLLKAAGYDPDILDKDVIPHIYSFPEEEHFLVEELQSFLGPEGHEYTAELKEALNLLNQGKNIGSALKINLNDDGRKFIQSQYNNWIDKEKTAQLDLQAQDVWNRLKPFLEVLLVMTQQYTAVAANPPYMGQKNMNGDLKNYVNKHYPKSKSDLMTVFMEVIPKLTIQDGRFAIINMPSWLFLSSFEKLREDYINFYQFDSLLHMGRGIFGIDFGSVSFVTKKAQNNEAIGNYFRLHERNFQHIYYEDIEKLFLYSNGSESYRYNFSKYRGDEGVTEIPVEGSTNGLKLFYPNVPQSNFSKIPGSPIAYWVSKQTINNFDKENKVYEFFESCGRIKTHNNEKYLKYFWEVACMQISRSKKWIFVENGGDKRKWFGNRITVVNWTNEAMTFYETNGGLSNSKYWSKNGISWAIVSSRGTSFRYKDEEAEFTSASPTILPTHSISIYYVLAFLNTKYVSNLLNILNPTMNTTVGDVLSLPLMLERHQEEHIEIKSSNSILLSKKDWDSRETSWDYEKSPLFNNSTSLKRSYQKWQEDVTKDFFQLHENEEELNRIFIDIYGLQDELKPDVHLKDITILQEELVRKALNNLESEFRKHGRDAAELPILKDEVISQFISYCVGLMMGRYRLDKPGMNIAHPEPNDEELAPYDYNGHTITIDDDAIVPLMGKDCNFPDDVLVRLKQLLLAIWGEESLTENLNFIQKCLGMDIHKWITEKFWDYHNRMYKKKPIYWLFSSNQQNPAKAAFRVLTYMHRMDRFTVQKILRNYLYPHQEYIKREIGKLKENEGNLSKLEAKRLEMFLNWEVECRSYSDILKELANKQIEFDLDDGVSVNYPKFEGAVAKI